MDSIVRTALEIAMDAHENQVDKAGVPYILHPLTVARNVFSDEAFVAALLHDVLEDSEFTMDHLQIIGIPEVILEALQLLTRDDDEPYMDYIRKIKENPIAREVKLADLNHNSDLSRLPEPTEQDRKRVEKYRAAIEILTEGGTPWRQN